MPTRGSTTPLASDGARRQLAAGRRRCSSSSGPASRADGADERSRQGRGRPRGPRAPDRALRERRPDDAVLSEEARGEERADTARLDAAAGLDRRPARRHPRVRRGPRPTGPCTSPSSRAACRSPARSRCRPGTVSAFDTRRRSGGRPRCRPLHGSSSAAPARRPRPCSSPRRSAASWSRWARPAPRRWRRARRGRRLRRTPAASTSGTRPRRSPSRWRPACHCTRLDGSPLVYNQRRPVPARPADLPA